MPSEGIGELPGRSSGQVTAWSTVRSSAMLVSTMIRRRLNTAHAVERPADLRFTHLLKHDLASRVWMHLHLHDVVAPVPACVGRGTGKVYSPDRNEGLGLRLRKKGP